MPASASETLHVAHHKFSKDAGSPKVYTGNFEINFETMRLRNVFTQALEAVRCVNDGARTGVGGPRG